MVSRVPLDMGACIRIIVESMRRCLAEVDAKAEYERDPEEPV